MPKIKFPCANERRRYCLHSHTNFISLAFTILHNLLCSNLLFITLEMGAQTLCTLLYTAIVGVKSINRSIYLSIYLSICYWRKIKLKHLCIYLLRINRIAGIQFKWSHKHISTCEGFNIKDACILHRPHVNTLDMLLRRKHRHTIFQISNTRPAIRYSTLSTSNFIRISVRYEQARILTDRNLHRLSGCFN